MSIKSNSLIVGSVALVAIGMLSASAMSSQNPMPGHASMPAAHAHNHASMPAAHGHGHHHASMPGHMHGGGHMHNHASMPAAHGHAHNHASMPAAHGHGHHHASMPGK